MNERIKELLIKSQLLEAIGENAYEEDGWEPIVEKFADLIIRECAEIAEQKQTYNDGHGIHLNIDQCILSEFGVE
jgi:hypothetical protein